VVVRILGAGDGVGGLGPADGLLLAVPASGLVDPVEVARRAAVEPPSGAVLLGTVGHVKVVVHVGRAERHVVMVTQRITYNGTLLLLVPVLQPLTTRHDDGGDDDDHNNNNNNYYYYY